MKTHCKHGHPWNRPNTKWRLHASGYRYRACRRCGSIAKNRRYACDEVFREAQKSRSQANRDEKRAVLLGIMAMVIPAQARRENV